MSTPNWYRQLEKIAKEEEALKAANRLADIAYLSMKSEDPMRVQGAMLLLLWAAKRIAQGTDSEGELLFWLRDFVKQFEDREEKWGAAEK